LLTNLLILPVQSYLVIAGGIALLLGLIFRPLGQVGGWVPVQMAGWMVFAYYALMSALTRWLKQPRKRRDELRSQFTSRLEAKGLAGVAAIVLVLTSSDARCPMATCTSCSSMWSRETPFLSRPPPANRCW
jgi:UDP:flavonoid glycosyltransferase YjiC (YdhE family)